MVENYVIPRCITMLIVIAGVLFCTWKWKNASEEKKLLPVKIVFWTLIVLEALKIFYLIAQRGKYEPSRYPIVFCSMVMFAYPLFCFKKNRFSEVAKAFSVIPSFLVFILFVAIQWQFKMSLIQGHSYVYHGAMLFVGVYLLTSGLYKFDFKGFYPLFLALSGYVAFSTVMSLFLGGDISYFGPKSSYLGFLYKMFGYIVGNLLLCLVFFGLCIGVYALLSLCGKKKTAPAVNEETKEETENV